MKSEHRLTYAATEYQSISVKTRTIIDQLVLLSGGSILRGKGSERRQ